MAGDIQRMVSDLEHAQAARRVEAAQQLAGLGEEACDAAVGLLFACRDTSDDVREWAIAALEQLGPPPPSAVAALAEALGDRQAEVAYWAATLLGRLEVSAAPAAEALAAALSEKHDDSVRERAAWALGKLGPAAVAARGALEQAAAADNPRLQRLARQALKKIGA